MFSDLDLQIHGIWKVLNSHFILGLIAMHTAGDVFQNSRSPHAFSAVAGQRHRVWGDVTLTCKKPKIMAATDINYPNYNRHQLSQFTMPFE